MSRKTERFRKDHEGLLKLAEELSNCLDVESLREDAGPTVKVLGRLAGTLKVHLVAEDNQLYPELLNSPNKKIKLKAEFYIKEMGGIKDVLGKYASKWMSTEAIKTDPRTFIVETKGLLTALVKRIDKENNELYKMIDEDSE